MHFNEVRTIYASDHKKKRKKGKWKKKLNKLFFKCKSIFPIANSLRQICNTIYCAVFVICSSFIFYFYFSNYSLILVHKIIKYKYVPFPGLNRKIAKRLSISERNFKLSNDAIIFMLRVWDEVLLCKLLNRISVFLFLRNISLGFL